MMSAPYHAGWTHATGRMNNTRTKTETSAIMFRSRSTYHLAEAMRDVDIHGFPRQWSPAAPPTIHRDSFADNIRGMLYGIAIGDALGRESESMSSYQRMMLHGHITGYPQGQSGLSEGLYTDDTQMSFWLLDHMLTHNTLDPRLLASTFGTASIEHSGRSVRSFQAAYLQNKMWHECGVRSAGNGAIMRIAPVILPYLQYPGDNLWYDTLLCGMITHNDPASHGACQAMMAWLWGMFQHETMPRAQWWVDTYIQHARSWERTPTYTTAANTDPEMLWASTVRKVVKAYARNLSVEEACNEWRSGPYLLETMPSLLYILMKHAHQPRVAVLQATQYTWDNDTIASLVASLMGAHYGEQIWRGPWVDNLRGCVDSMQDQNHVQTSINYATSRWA